MHYFVTIGEFKLELQLGTPNLDQNRRFLSRATLQFDRWHLKTTRHLSWSTSSFVHNLVAIGESQLKLQFGNARFRSKSVLIFPCDLGIWRMTLQNIRAPLLSYFKYCASLCSHRWIQTGFTVQKRPNWVQKVIFCPLWPWHSTDDLEKTIGYLFPFYATSSYVHNFVAICEIKLELQSGNAQIGAKFALTSVTLTCDFWLCLFA